MRLNLCFKHAAALGLDVDRQVTEKVRALLGKQRHKVTNMPAMAWKDVPAFYQILCQTTSIIQFGFALVYSYGCSNQSFSSYS